MDEYDLTGRAAHVELLRRAVLVCMAEPAGKKIESYFKESRILLIFVQQYYYYC